MSTVTTTEATRNVVTAGARSVVTSGVTGGVVMVAIIGIVRHVQVLGSSHEVSHTGGGGMNVAYVSGRCILLDGYGEGVLELLVGIQQD